MSIRYITVDSCARIHEVSHLRDQFGYDTKEPTLADTCIIHYDGRDYAASVDPDIPIYTVH